MATKIDFTDISKPIHTLPVIIGAILCLGCGAYIIIGHDPDAPSRADLIVIVAAFLGIVLIAVPQIQNIRKSNTIRFNNRGLTAKLLGRKTFGFEFRNVTSLLLDEKELQIKVTGMELITLSRKQYHDNSLLQLKEVIEHHKTQS